MEYNFTGIIRFRSVILLCFLGFVGYGGNDFEGFKFAAGYGFDKELFRLNYNRKLWEENLLFDGNTDAFAGMFNDHISVGLDLYASKKQKDNSHLFFGPEISYEVNLIFLQSRFSVLSHFDNHGQYNVSIRPEIGLTVIGGIALTYGYNYTFYKSENTFNAKHNITFSMSSDFLGY